MDIGAILIIFVVLALIGGGAYYYYFYYYMPTSYYTSTAQLVYNYFTTHSLSHPRIANIMITVPAYNQLNNGTLSVDVVDKSGTSVGKFQPRLSYDNPTAALSLFWLPIRITSGQQYSIVVSGDNQTGSYTDPKTPLMA